jgi:hypothetical protein
MNKSEHSSSFGDRLLARLGDWYPITVLIIVQLCTSSLGLLLTAISSQVNAEFSHSQTISATTIGGFLLLTRNIVLLALMYVTSRAMFGRLTKRANKHPFDADPEEGLSWRQASSFAWRYTIFALAMSFFLVLPTVLVYLHIAPETSPTQMVFVALAAIAIGLGFAVLEYLIVESLMRPAREALLPKQFEAQLDNLRGLPLMTKILVTVIVLLIVGVLLIAPIGYHQTITTLRGEIDSHLILISLQSQLIIVSIGVLLLGFILAYSVTHSISVPIRTMIRTFGEVENGDLTQRLKVVSTDEVGKLTIHINYLLAQLEGLQSSLEELRNTQPTHTAESDSATPALNVPLTLHLVEAVATQAALATENARLYNDVSQRADRERIISEITTRIRSTTDPQVMLQTALDELKRALRTDNIRIRPYFPSPADQNPVHKPRPKKNKST